MVEQVKSEVRMCRKGSEFGIIYEVPMNLTEDEKIAYAKAKHISLAKKRPYKFEYKVQS